MREIKFRAWTGRFMLYFDLQDIEASDRLAHGKAVQLNDTLMQFTGLCDLTGKEIYEGDIVRRDGWLYEIRWSFVSAGFDLSTKRDSYPQQEDGYAYHSGLYDTEIIEIIGNIYENPELAGGTTKGLDCEG